MGVGNGRIDQRLPTQRLYPPPNFLDASLQARCLIGPSGQRLLLESDLGADWVHDVVVLGVLFEKV
jgi:hypothetical protein